MDPAQYPAIFVIDLQEACYFLKVHLHHISKIKVIKQSQNSRNQGFSYYFCVMMEGSGSVPLDYWIRIQEAKKHTDPDQQY
jgi:hypothetical protein